MACFLAPAAEALVVTVAKKVIEKRGQNRVDKDIQIHKDELPDSGKSHRLTADCGEKILLDEKVPVESEENVTGKFWADKISWLANMLWGGSFLLLVEHIWHGEIVPVPPFLTAMANAKDTQAMLHEIATVGTSMAVLITLTWGVMVLTVSVADSYRLRKKKLSR